MKSQFLRHSLKTYATQLAQTVLLTLLAICTARLLGPANKGIYSILVLIPMMVVTLGRCGLGNAAIYFSGRKPESAVVFNGFLLIGMIGVVSVLLSLLAIVLLRHNLLRDIPMSGLIWIVVMIPVFYFYDFFASCFVAVMQIQRRNQLILMYPFCQLILLLMTVAVLRRGLAGALLSLSVAMMLGIGWSIRVLKRRAANDLLRVDTALMRQMVRFGLRSHPGGVLEMLNNRADFFLVNLFLGPAAVGFYSVGVNLAEIVWRFPEAVVLILMPKVARMDAEQAKSFTPRICRLILFPVLMICLTLLLVGRFLILLFFGGSFLPAVHPFFFLLPGFMAFAIWKILAGDLVAQGHPLLYSSTSATAFVAMILLDLWWIPAWGIAGAAAASSVAYLAATAMMIIIYRKLTGIRLGDLLIPQKNDFLLLRDAFRRNTKQAGPG
jgi:O-antigen/teichoic acid export membrane protein